MSSKIPLRNLSTDLVGNKRISKISAQTNSQKKTLKECLNSWESGQLCVDDMQYLIEELALKPRIGDHIQYGLYTYCQKDPGEINADLVIKVAQLCYSQISVQHFNNLSRFLGCAYYIASCLLKKEKYSSALEVINSLYIRRKEIQKCSETDPDISSYICNVHNSLMAAAISLYTNLQTHSDKELQLIYSLALESLKIFNLTNKENVEAGKKIVKTCSLYFQTNKHCKQEEALALFQMLKKALKVVHPKFNVINYFLYYLFRISQIRKANDSGIYDMMQRTIDLVLLLTDGSESLKKVFCKVLNFFWNEFQLGKWMTNEDYEILNGKYQYSEVYFALFTIVVGFGVQFVSTEVENNCGSNISSALVHEFSKTIFEYHKVYARSSLFHSSTSEDSLSFCLDDSIIGNLHKIQYLVRLCLKNKVPGSLSLVTVSREAFKLSVEYLECTMSKICQKEKIFYAWKYSVIHHRNTVEDICRYPQNEETWHSLKDCSYEILKEIVSSSHELPFDFKSVNVLFHRWHSASLRLKNYQDALFVCAVYYAFYPKEENEIMSMWLQTKSESKNEIFEEITVAELLKTCDRSLRQFSKKYDGSNICMKSVLLMELKAYSTCPPDTFQNSNTSYNLANRIWKQLEKCNLDLWEMSVGLFAFISANIAGDHEKLPSHFYQKYEKHINDLMNWKQKGKTQCRSLLHAANLKFSLFLYNVKLAEKSEGNMDTSHMVLGYLKKAEEVKVKFGEEVDLNLTCDVIPSSSHLTVDLETNYLEELNKIVSLWNSALENGFEDSPSSTEFELWFRNVKQVAHLYELIGEYQRAFTSWLMFYKIGKLHSDPGAMLLGLTHLIENCADVDESGIKEEAELITKKLGSEPTDKYALVRYALAVAGKHLKNKKSEQCLEYLSLAKKILEGLRPTMSTYILNARFWCVVSQFLSVYKEYEAVFDYPTDTDVRVMAFKAFSYANSGGRNYLIKSVTQSESMELVLTMLEVNLWAYHLHGVYRQTDFMRFFLDDLYQIVQRLFLPTRTAEMLVRLAEVDLICEKMSDCQGKVNKLKSILTTVGASSEATKTEKTSPYLSVPQPGGDAEVFHQRFVSPARFVDKRDVETSPVLFYLNEAKSFRGGLEHPKKCRCRLCQNFLIQTLTMNAIWLEAELYNMGNNPNLAAKCYAQASEVLNRVELVRAEQSKILSLELAAVSKKFPEELDFKLTSVQFHCARFLIKYALFEASSLQTVTENVMKTMLKVSKLMKKMSYEVKLLQWCFAELKLFCVVLNKGDEKPPKKVIKSPAIFKSTAPTQTPAVSGTLTALAKKRRGKGAKSPGLHPPGVKLSFEDDKNDEMNSAFIVSVFPSAPDYAKTIKRVIQPRKLNFCTDEPENEVKTVQKVTKEKVNCVTSRKLNFDLSDDLFEDSEVVEVKKKEEPKKDCEESKKPTKEIKKSTRAPTKPKGNKDLVKIYTDAKDDTRTTRKRGTNGLKTRVKQEKT